MQSKRSPQISIIAESILMNQCGRNSMIVNDFPPRTVTISPWISASSSHIRRHIMANATGSTRVEPDKSPRLYLKDKSTWKLKAFVSVSSWKMSTSDVLYVIIICEEKPVKNTNLFIRRLGLNCSIYVDYVSQFTCCCITFFVG